MEPTQICHEKGAVLQKQTVIFHQTRMNMSVDRDFGRVFVSSQLTLGIINFF